MKWAVANFRSETICAVLAALIYDEDKFIGNVRTLFGFYAHCFTDDTGRFFYAVVIDPLTGRIFIVFRGTDGKNAFGRALSWLTNLRLASDKDGYHKGFRAIAEDAVVKMSSYISNATEIYVAGHSQGAGVAVPFIMLLCRKIDATILPKLVRIEANLFCSPPAVNQVGADEIAGYIFRKLVTIKNFKMVGDLISEPFLRQLKGFLAGRDVGKLIALPDVIRKKYWFADPVSHSPTVILAGFASWLHENYETSTNGDKTLINHVLNEYYLVN